MTERFVWDPKDVAAMFREFGYDVDETAARLGAGGSISARRERSDRAEVVVIDGGGRFKAEITVVVGDSTRRVQIERVVVRIVETEQRVTTLTAVLPNADALAPMLDAIERPGRPHFEAADIHRDSPVE